MGRCLVPIRVEYAGRGSAGSVVVAEGVSVSVGVAGDSVGVDTGVSVPEVSEPTDSEDGAVVAGLVGAEFPEVVEAPQDTRAKEINRSARSKDRFFLKICTSE